MDAITPEIDGIRLSALWEAGEVSRTTAFELLKIARIEPESRRISGSQRPVAYLSREKEQMMRALIDKLREGATVPQLRSEAATALERVQSRTIPDDPEPEPETTVEPLPLLERLQAIEAAMRTGAPLTTADVRALLLVSPGGEVVQRGKVQARRLARNHWIIEAAC